MIRLSSIIDTFEAEYLSQYSGSVVLSHRKALSAMKGCRTALSRRMQATCTTCARQMVVPHSCGHRNCPHCQHHDSQQWLERQLKRQVPAPYFLVTFTLPAHLRTLAWRHQRTLYALMMQCSWDTVRTFAHNDKQLQGTPGAIAVLHTHSRRLDYHPHVHLLMPGAAIDQHKRLWRIKRTQGKTRYLFNHKALAKVFRAKMLARLRHEGLSLPTDCPRKWVVDCTSVGHGDKALVYLGRYLYRGVVQEKDIVACANGQVTFRYRDSKTKRVAYRTIPGPQFLRLLMAHVLPKGFRRARNFGFLHPNSKRLLALLHYLFGIVVDRPFAWVRQRPAFVCRHCGGEMKIVQTCMPPAVIRTAPLTV